MEPFLTLVAYTGKKSVVALETAGFMTMTLLEKEHSASHFVE